MDQSRFEALAEAYGADLRRWPAAERGAAEAFRAQNPDAARSVLETADKLDYLLGAAPPAIPSAALREAVLAAAPKARPARRGIGFWLSGAGLAAAAVAGVIVGTAATASVVGDLRTDAVLAEVLPDDAMELLPVNLSQTAAKPEAA